jgi:branched-chain amino acid transport system ATP-binding protein
MDEPTAGMGPAERQGLMKLTQSIVRNRKIGVLFTEHDMKVVFNYAERIIVLNRGEMIFEGTADEVQKNNEVQEIYFGTTAP